MLPLSLSPAAAVMRTWRNLALALPLLLSPAHPHGAFHERLLQLTAALDRTPGDPRVHFELAEIFCRHGDWALALGSADTVDELQPGSFPTDLIRGEALLGREQPAAARTALDRFLAAHSNHARARILRARAIAATAGTAAALADYRAALESGARPEPDHLKEAAEALVASGHNDEARQILSRALAQIGPDPALLPAALNLEIAAGRFDDALTRIAALEAGAPRPEPWMARRAQILALAGRNREARTAWTELLRHLDNLPTLERGHPRLRALAQEAHSALASNSR